MSNEPQSKEQWSGKKPRELNNFRAYNCGHHEGKKIPVMFHQDLPSKNDPDRILARKISVPIFCG